MPTTELVIKWEGVAPGLAEKRLSLGAFGEPLTLLLSTLRRIASNLVSDAIEEKTMGRFANAARQLDIEITDLVKESSGFDSAITITPLYGENHSLFLDLAENAGFQLLDAIDSERQGILKNSGARKYLASLPPGISRQTYRLHSNGTVLKEVSFSSTEISVLPVDLPYLSRYIGKVVGVGFDPGKTEVKIRTDSKSVSISATDKQVDIALELRHSTVSVVVVVAGLSQRLLIIQEAYIPVYRSSRETAVFERWSGVLKRLAQ